VVPVPGGAFLCGAAYGAASAPDVVTGTKAVEAYLASAGAHYAVFVQGDLNGPQPARAAAGVTVLLCSASLGETNHGS
jgi:hypothetical protein